MIIPNGTIQPRIKTAHGLDAATGIPLAPDPDAWGDAIPCQWVYRTYDTQGRTPQGEAHTDKGYTLWIDDQPFEAHEVRLTDDQGRDLGTFSIRMLTYLRAVAQIQLTL